jgi:hypothetical protein
MPSSELPVPTAFDNALVEIGAHAKKLVQFDKDGWVPMKELIEWFVHVSGYMVDEQPLLMLVPIVLILGVFAVIYGESRNSPEWSDKKESDALGDCGLRVVEVKGKGRVVERSPTSSFCLKGNVLFVDKALVWAEGDTFSAAKEMVLDALSSYSIRSRLRSLHTPATTSATHTELVNSILKVRTIASASSSSSSLVALN